MRDFPRSISFALKMSSSDLTSHNSEEDLSDYDEALDEVNKRINEAFDILKRETRKARKEKRSLDKVAKKLEHVHFSTMVQLNVGGHLFSTSVATLSRDPGKEFIKTVPVRFFCTAPYLTILKQTVVPKAMNYFRYCFPHPRTVCTMKCAAVKKCSYHYL